MSHHQNLLPAKLVAHRYGVCLRTLDRWTDREGLAFPGPVRILKRRYWPLDELEAWERRAAASAAEAA